LQRGAPATERPILNRGAGGRSDQVVFQKRQADVRDPERKGSDLASWEGNRFPNCFLWGEKGGGTGKSGRSRGWGGILGGRKTKKNRWRISTAKEVVP